MMRKRGNWSQNGSWHLDHLVGGRGWPDELARLWGPGAPGGRLMSNHWSLFTYYFSLRRDPFPRPARQI